MIESALILLVLLQIKHWYVDFVDQSMSEVNSKGTYGEWLGVRHSLKHAIATAFCFWVVGGNEFALYAVVIGLIDGMIHYHVDWAKMNWGNRDIQNPLFWNHLGLDQMVHQLTYIILTYLVVSV